MAPDPGPSVSCDVLNLVYFFIFSRPLPSSSYLSHANRPLFFGEKMKIHEKMFKIDSARVFCLDLFAISLTCETRKYQFCHLHGVYTYIFVYTNFYILYSFLFQISSWINKYILKSSLDNFINMSVINEAYRNPWDNHVAWE